MHLFYYIAAFIYFILSVHMVLCKKQGLWETVVAGIYPDERVWCDYVFTRLMLVCVASIMKMSSLYGIVLKLTANWRWNSSFSISRFHFHFFVSSVLCSVQGLLIRLQHSKWRMTWALALKKLSTTLIIRSVLAERLAGSSISEITC